MSTFARRPAGRFACTACTLLAGAFMAGCSVFKPPPEALDLRGAEVAAIGQHPIPVRNGTGQRASIEHGATLGAGVGAGMLPFAVPACAAAGPAVGFCLLAVVPVAAAAGAGTGAIEAKVNGEPREEMLARRDLVLAEVTAADAENLLAARVRQSLQAQRGFETADGSGGAGGSGSAPWKVEVAVSKVTMYGTLEDSDFRLRVRGKLRLVRTSDNGIVYRADVVADSDDQVVPAGQGADPNLLVRSRLDRGMQLLGDKLAAALLART